MGYIKPNIVLRLGIVVIALYYLSIYFAWTDSAEVRYRKYYRAMYDMIYNESGQVSIVGMGSSRAQTMFGANELQQEVYGESSNNVVYNMATSQRGKGFHYVVMRDFFEQRQASEVWLHFINTDIREEYRVHPWFYIVSKNTDIVESTLMRKDLSWYEKIIHGGSVFFKKHSSIIEDYLTNKLLLAQPKKVTPAKSRDHLTANPIRPNSIETAMKKPIQDLLHKGEEWNLVSDIEYRNNSYISKIIELAKTNGSDIKFFYIPRLMEPTLSDSTIHQIHSQFGVKVLAPEPLDLIDIFPRAYADAGHGSNLGRRIYAKLLAKKNLDLNEENKLR